MTPEEATTFVRTTLLEPILRLVEMDPHGWSNRPCQTCAAISALAGRPFGCVAKAGKGEK